MKKELMLEAIDKRRILTTSETARNEGLEGAMNAIQMSIMSGEMPLGEFIRTFVRLACNANTAKISISEEQLMTMFDIIGYKDFRVVGNVEDRGRKRLDVEDTRLTWAKLSNMSEEERAMLSGCAMPRKPKD